ncbi:hypothetical protein DFH29DRAFT_619204 [Suillus ampliporus]|nr:hypothetical protein DFH29DRAFT_619204 [Suillus ampliporus]
MPQRAQKARTSTYGQGNLESIPAPLEPDSDPEFNPGTFVYETKKRGKRKATAAENASLSSPRKSRKRRSDVLGNFGSSFTSRKRRPMDPDASRQHNPLKQYFDDDLGLQSASDDDETNEEYPEDGDSAEEHESEPEQPVVLRTMTAFIKASKEGTPAQPSHSQTPVDDDSVTEPESEHEVVHVSRKRKSPASEQIMPASKRIKTPYPDDESETEPESDEELPVASTVSRQPNIVKLPESDSETEPEDEDEIENPVQLIPVFRSSSTDTDTESPSKTRLPACSWSESSRTSDIGQRRGYHSARVNQYISERIPEGRCQVFLGSV